MVWVVDMVAVCYGVLLSGDLGHLFGRAFPCDRDTRKYVLDEERVRRQQQREARPELLIDLPAPPHNDSTLGTIAP